MKKLFTLTFLLVCGLSAATFAQRPEGAGRPQAEPTNNIPGTIDNSARGNGKVSGTIKDSVSQQPVEFASVSLVDLKTNRPVDGATTDDKGKFQMKNLADGNYKLMLSFIGYKGKQIDKIKIDGRTNIDLDDIVLVPDVIQLNAVTVTGQTQMIEERVDRLVYNAEKDITSKGGDATEVMRKVPMLSVDLDGNVSLRGSSNVRVLINNKPSTILASSVADALKQIPADMIKSVEVITSPSAKYDAEGTAGIINIITKKNTLQGATLDFDSGVGNRGANLGLRGGYRTGKMGFNLGGYGRIGYNIIGKGDNLQEGMKNGVPFSVRQLTDSKNTYGFGSYNLGWDMDITDKSFITASVRYGTRNSTSSQGISTLNSFGTTPAKNSFRDVDVKDLSGTVDVNVDYTRQLKKPQQEFSILTQYSRNNRTNDFDADLFDSGTSSTLLGQEGNRNASYNQESTVQLDYTSPIKKNQIIEFGGKGIFRQVDSDFTYYSNVSQPRQSSSLVYDQNVAAAYLSYTYSTKNKYTFKVGSRYEYTTIAATQGEVGLSIPNYGNLVPSINVSKTFKGGRTVKAAYNRRLQRPGIQFLNPNINAANPQNITVGNPDLAPELTDQYEISSSWFKKSVYINFSLFARNTNNSIESVRTTNEQGVITTTYGNIGQKQNYGANVFGNVTLFGKWQIGGGVDAYYVYLANNSNDPSLGASNSGIVASGRVFTNLTLPKGWGIQGFGFTRGRDVQLQGYSTGFRIYSLGVKKEFANKRGSIGMSTENFLTKAFRINTELETPTFTQRSINDRYMRGVRVNFSYKLGKMSFDDQPRRRRKSVNNDDVKSGGDGGGDGGGQQAAPATGGRPR
ncbi:TonB-dependent receptor domain-containing protein [Persicitalea sp.]|uniref:TonB-dependent receptor domain-containing protein n=1 Tax=Persicitalea sp. TaxID=3100273 RepID=UPI0035931F14